MPPPPPPFIRLASCCNLVKCSWNVRWKSVRSLAYTTCSDVADSSSDTSHPVSKIKFKVINETLKQLESERSSALLFIRELKESGFKHDLETYMSVVRLLCHWDWGSMDVRSNNLLNDVIDNTNWEVFNFEISDKLFDALMEEKLIKAVDGLVEVYASVGKFEEAMYTLSEMKSRGGLVVSTETCNFVLNKLIMWDKEDMVESVYRELKRNGLIPNVYTYGMLIRGHGRKGCLKEAWDVFRQMEEAGIEPNAFIYSRYIHVLCCNGKTDLAFQVVKDLNKPLLDVFSYACVIRGFIKESKLQDAEDVLLHEMKLREVVPDARCYGALIRGYCEKGDIVKALVLCKEMESRGIQTIDHGYVRWMMQYLCGLGMLDEALYVFKHFKQQSRVFLDGVSFSIAIDAACKLGKMDDAMGLLEQMKGNKIKPIVMHTLGSKPTGFQEPYVGQDEGVPDARDEAAVGYVGQLHTTQQITLALQQLTSLSGHHAVILKKLRECRKW
ncbi:hypothetical protein Lser_V15G01983 [Lactuca serriola]